MAETLGSLVDKLSIKNLRLWHLDELLEETSGAPAKREELQAKRELVLKQSRDLMDEVNGFFVAALEGKVTIRDEKIKMYENKNVKPSDAIKELDEQSVSCHFEISGAGTWKTRSGGKTSRIPRLLS